jgi:hypothetical protein
MDDIVRQAMAKWPNVPHCYGWLGLDARGHWRMRDQHAQDLDLPGDKLSHPALVAFIARNYGHDERGCWFFQNGPQRVYVNLEVTPYVASLGGDGGFMLQTGAPLGAIEAAWMTTEGALVVRHGANVAQLDDRDLAQVLDRLRLDGGAIGDETLLGWLEADADATASARRGAMSLVDGERTVAVMPIAAADLAAHCGFQRRPQPPP